jgi:hypothetical protein
MKILQTDRRLPYAVREWGCLFFCILTASGKEFSADEITAIYQSAQTTGILGYLDAKGKFHAGERFDEMGGVIDGCYVKDPVSLANLAGMRASSYWKAGKDVTAPSGAKEFLHYHRNADTPKGMNNAVHDHFVNGDGKSNVTNDSLGQSNTVKYGFLENKRFLS